MSTALVLFAWTVMALPFAILLGRALRGSDQSASGGEADRLGGEAEFDIHADRSRTAGARHHG